MKLLVLGGCAALLVCATALPRWRLDVPALDIQGFSFQYDGELTDDDLMNPGCWEELEASAIDPTEIEAWVEGPLLWPLATHTLVAESSRSPADEVLWMGLYVDGELLADATWEDGGIVERDGSAWARLEAPVHALSGRRLRLECLFVDGLSHTEVRGPPLAVAAWRSVGWLRRPGGR